MKHKILFFSIFMVAVCSLARAEQDNSKITSFKNSQGSTLEGATQGVSETKILTVNVTEQEVEKVTLKKGEQFEIHVSNPGSEWHSRGFQEKLPDTNSDAEHPELYHALTAEIWYGSKSLLGDVEYGMNYWFHCFTSCLVEPTNDANASDGDPLVYHITASNTAGSACIYFYFFIENKPGSMERSMTHYKQNYFPLSIEVTVK